MATTMTLNGKAISKMLVKELREELVARGLDTKGLKANLVARLEEALMKEQQQQQQQSQETANTNTQENGDHQQEKLQQQVATNSPKGSPRRGRKGRQTKKQNSKQPKKGKQSMDIVETSQDTQEQQEPKKNDTPTKSEGTPQKNESSNSDHQKPTNMVDLLLVETSPKKDISEREDKKRKQEGRQVMHNPFIRADSGEQKEQNKRQRKWGSSTADTPNVSTDVLKEILPVTKGKEDPVRQATTPVTKTATPVIQREIPRETPAPAEVAEPETREGKRRTRSSALMSQCLLQSGHGPMYSISLVLCDPSQRMPWRSC